MLRTLTFILFLTFCHFALATEEPNCDRNKDDIDASCDCDKSRDEHELSLCLAAKRDDSEKQLNKLYLSLVNRLSLDGKTRLRNAQRAWLRFRDAECLYIVEGPSLGVGSSWNSYHNQCVKEVTDRRIEDLERHVACTQNDCPK